MMVSGGGRKLKSKNAKAEIGRLWVGNDLERG